MVAQRKYPEELRERATRLAVEARRDPATARGAIRRVATQLGVHPEALRTWVRQAEIDGGDRPGTTSEDAARIAELERENRELRKVNEILRTASAFFAAAEVPVKPCMRFSRTPAYRRSSPAAFDFPGPKGPGRDDDPIKANQPQVVL